MKKILIYSFCFLLFSCNDTDINTPSNDVNTNVIQENIENNIQGLTKIDIPEGIESVNIYNWADNTFLGSVEVEDGNIWIGSKNASMSVRIYKSKKSTRSGDYTDELDLDYIKDAVIYKSSDNIVSIEGAENINSGYNGEDFLGIFPAGKDNRNITAPQGSTNFSHEVLYVSEGYPFSIYPIYSQGWYDLTLGLFYYDTSGTRHDINFWGMKEVGWKMSYSDLNRQKFKDPSMYTISKTENAKGYQITLPEHYIYGFYIWSTDDSNSGKYFSYSQENSCKENHTVNIVDKDGINYVAFEDQDNGDWDINDLICYVNPKIPIIENPTQEKIQEELKKIQTSIIVPDSIDKIVHGFTPDSCDVEARYDGKGHDYVRISKSLKNDEIIEIDLDSMNQYCEKDDMRITAANDITVIYCKDNASENCNYCNSLINVKNECTTNYYNKVTALITGLNGNKDDNDSYQIKIDLYPKNEDCFNKVVKIIELQGWDNLFTIKKRKNE